MTRQLQNSNLYVVLGICTDATPAELRAAYHRAALRTHPDKGGSSEDFRLASRAFEVLSCPTRRKSYDSSQLPPSRKRPCTRSLVAKEIVTSSTTSASAATPGPHPKRRRMSLFPRRRHTQTQKKKDLHTTLTAMHRLWQVLQSMTAKSRHEVFTGMTQVMRKALIRFKERYPGEISPCVRDAHACGAWPARHTPQTLATSIRTCSRAGRTKYQAQMHMKALRLYAPPQESLNSAIEHQIQLSRLRYVIAAGEKADPGIWSDAKKVYHVCQTVLGEMGTSENDFGLRAFVHIRAQRWLGQRVQITSSSTVLSAALDTHARLLMARAASWEVFRAEWIQLMLGKGRLALTDAEAVADKARQTELQSQVTKALFGAEKALGKERCRARKRTAPRARMQEAVATEFVKDEKCWPKRTRMSNVAVMGG